MIKFARIIFVLMSALMANALAAHEFWIEPQRYQVESDAPIVATFRNGELFDGIELAFFDRTSERLQMINGAQTLDLLPRNGDRPAIDQPNLGVGLHILAHETSPSKLTYKTWEKFQKFADHKDFPGISARHDARGLPRENFKEAYTRHAKALVNVGNGAGADTEIGLATEFVALTNPYGPSFTQNMQVRLTYEGVIRPDAQVEIFEKSPEGTVTVSLTRTNIEGVATFPTKPGHVYLIDAVVLREADPETGAVWETLWASLTFMVPMR